MYGAESILKHLYYTCGETNPESKCPQEYQRIQVRRGNFKKMLKRKQYRQIQRLLDDNETITDEMSRLNFASGVRYGIMFMIEVFGGVNNDR